MGTLGPLSADSSVPETANRSRRCPSIAGGGNCIVRVAVDVFSEKARHSSLTPLCVLRIQSNSLQSLYSSSFYSLLFFFCFPLFFFYFFFFIINIVYLYLIVLYSIW